MSVPKYSCRVCGVRIHFAVGGWRHYPGRGRVPRPHHRAEPLKGAEMSDAEVKTAIDIAKVNAGQVGCPSASGGTD